MAISLSDLPPKYQQQAMEKYRKQQTRRGPMPSTADVQDPGKPMKYRNNHTERVTSSGAVIRFDSQKEARRYDQLAARLRAGEIRDLRLQQTFTLQEAYVSSSGDTVRAITYKADFTYEERPAFWRGYEEQCPDDKWNLVVEDVKGARTETYKIKKKLMEERGYHVREV